MKAVELGFTQFRLTIRAVITVNTTTIRIDIHFRSRRLMPILDCLVERLAIAGILIRNAF